MPDKLRFSACFLTSGTTWDRYTDTFVVVFPKAVIIFPDFGLPSRRVFPNAVFTVSFRLVSNDGRATVSDHMMSVSRYRGVSSAI
jgi:hypothetical protein